MVDTLPARLAVPEEALSLKRLSVIMPAYNEGAHIYANLRRVCAVLRRYDLELIVVDDGSDDATCGEAQRAADEGCPVRVVRHDVNRGKGAALFQGFGFASGELIVFLDSDLEIAPEFVPRLLEQMQMTGAEVVVGVKKTNSNGFPAARRVLSGLYRQLIAFLFGLSLSDTQTGIKLFKRQVLEAAIPRMSISRFAFDIELLVAAVRFGYRVAECPVEASFRRVGRLGRMRLGHLAGMAIDTLLIYYRASFWTWLEPGWMTRLWMLIFVIGVFLLGIGVGKLITPLIPEPPIRRIVYVVALQFLPRVLRDWLLVLGGGLLLTLALVQLNKSLLNAFARRDRGDLAGIFNKKP